jgi:HD-GYP domain-containing protein (c-di-GMP phosphodiesterase class II)
MSALSRMASSEHRQVEIAPGDMIIISATPIPGNEKLVSRVVNELMKRGANVVYEKMYDVHVSGHACQEEQKLMLDSFIETLASSIDARDKITSGHSTRVKMYSTLIAYEFGMEKNDISILEKAAALHDIGKIGIRDSVLQKEGKLTAEEYEHIQEHVEITHNILEKIHMSKDFQQITEIACSHHEKFDGTGYYRGLKGVNIPFGGRVLAVSDVFDAITSKRHYRDKMPIEKVIDIIQSGSGNHFDPLVVEKFLAIKLDKIVNVFLTENKVLKLNKTDLKTLEKYNLLDLYYSIVNNCSNKLLQVFNKYYVGLDLENE